MAVIRIPQVLSYTCDVCGSECKEENKRRVVIGHIGTDNVEAVISVKPRVPCGGSAHICDSCAHKAIKKAYIEF